MQGTPGRRHHPTNMRAITAAALALAACCLALLAPTSVNAQMRRRSLNDDNFEHVTQASTGQTTGVW